MRLHPWAGMGLLIGLCMGVCPRAAHAAMAEPATPPAAATRAGAAAPALVCSLRPAQPVLGHALHWEIRARNLPPLPPLRPAQLGHGWLLQGQSSESASGPGGTSQTLVLRLYPLAAGRLRLPEMRAGGARCPPRSVRVAVAEAGQAPVYVAARVATPGATEGQALRIELDVADGGGLAWEPVTARSDDGILHPLGSLDTRAADGTTEVLRQSWSFTPTHAGEFTLRFGLLRGHRFGELLVFPAAPLRGSVRPLPAYWPAGWPVGHATLRLRPAPRHLELGAVGVLRARLEGVQVGRQALAAMLRADAHAAGLRIGEPQLHRLAGPMLGAAPAWDIELPWRAERAGRLAYPRLRLAYYDPERGAPGLALADWGGVRVHDPRPLRIVLAFVAVGGLVLLLTLLRLGVGAARIAWCRARWRRIARRGDIVALRGLWRQARESGDPDAITLRTWVAAQRCGGRAPGGPELERSIDPVIDPLLERMLECEQRRLYARPREP
ncbi:MAG: hypothetical protein KGJ03_09970 [Betaproteobacteria bacterium]|nr:hypothetical protein [Betaproteobacteria bacterium]